jgi:hypothetical protein
MHWLATVFLVTLKLSTAYAVIYSTYNLDDPAFVAMASERCFNAPEDLSKAFHVGLMWVG